GAAEGRELGMGAESPGTEPHSQLSPFETGCSSQCVVDQARGVCPSPWPECELCLVHLVDAEPVVFSKGGPGQVEVRSRGFEVPTAHFKVGPVQEQHVGEAARDAA